MDKTTIKLSETNISILDKEKLQKLDLENLIELLKKSIGEGNPFQVKDNVNLIKTIFLDKYNNLVSLKKQAYLESGGDILDFYFSSPQKDVFNTILHDFKKHLNEYYTQKETQQKENYQKKLKLIDKLKNLVTVEENINTTFKAFRKIQSEWSKTGFVPKAYHEDLQKTYQHHIEIFYDYIDLNRNLRDIDFKHNLEEKKKIISAAIALKDNEDITKSFKELQVLHKIWKEETGPVGKEHRESIWEEFKAASNPIREQYFKYKKSQNILFEKKIAERKEIIEKVKLLITNPPENFSKWRSVLSQLSNLNEKFKAIEGLPQRLNQKIWDEFKVVKKQIYLLRKTFLSNEKKTQKTYILERVSLIDQAKKILESEDWHSKSNSIIELQKKWKSVGYLPQKKSDELWNMFSGLCNQFFAKLKLKNNEGLYETQKEALEHKKNYLDTLNQSHFDHDEDKVLDKVKNTILKWTQFGEVPIEEKNIDQLFFQKLNDFLNKNKKVTTYLQYAQKLHHWANVRNFKSLEVESLDLQKKLTKINQEISVIELNMTNIKNIDKNPIFKDVYNNLIHLKSSRDTYKEKLDLIREISKRLG